MGLGHRWQKKYEWIDTSSYSRSDKEREPHCWTYYTEHMRITLFISRFWKKDKEEPKWLFTCNDVDEDEGVVGPSTMSEEEAKITALNRVAERIGQMLNDVSHMAEVENGKVRDPRKYGETASDLREEEPEAG